MDAVNLVDLAYCKELLSLDDRDDAFTLLLIRSCSLRIEGLLLRHAAAELVAWNFKRTRRSRPTAMPQR
jgi:hypothetical protein